MPAGRPPKPQALKALEGNPGKRPPPVAAAKRVAKLPNPPRGLSLVARREWRRLGKELEEAGRITLLDLRAFELVCVAYARWMEARNKVDALGRWQFTPSGYPMTTPWAADERKDWDQYLKALREFGLTLASSEKVPIAKIDEDEADPAALWMMRGGKA